MADIFISYRRKDMAAVDALAQSLERAGLTVWIDRNEIGDAANIQARIENGLANCGALLAWFSADYPRSRACQWEITAALIAARADKSPVHRVLIVNPEAGDTHLQPFAVRNTQHFAAPALDDAAGFDDLAIRIAAAVRAIPGPLGALRQFARPSCHGFKPIGSNRFVGRVGDLWQIHDALARGDYAIVAGQPAPSAAGQLVQVHGSGGIGKSLLAEEYALRFGTFWPGGIYWLRALGNPDNSTESPASLIQRRAQEYSRQLAGFVADLGPDPKGLDDAQLRRELGRILDQAGHPYLWIVDDLPECTRAELETWLAPGVRGQTLVTTRFRRQDGAGFLLPLELLPDADARELLTRDHPPQPDEAVAVAAILKHLDGHALALDIARAACRRQGYARFYALLENPGKDALEFASGLAGELPNGHNPSIAVTFLAGFTDLPEEGKDFLRLAAQLATAPIEHSLVVGCLAIADNLERQEAGQRADLGMQQASDRSLAEDLVSGKEGATVYVHTLVSRTLRFHDTDSARQAALRQAAVKALSRAMAAGADIRNHGQLDNVALHATQLAAEATTEVELKLAAHVGRYEFEAARYPAARRWLEATLTIRRRVLGEEHPDTLASLNNLASTLRSQGDLPGARALEEQALEISRRVLGEEHPDTLSSLNNLASTLWSQGDLPGARALEEQALEIKRRVLGEEHPSTLTSLNNLAETLSAQGDLPGARALHEQALTIRRRVQGEEHPSTLTSMSNLAETLSSQGDLPGARALEEQALEIKRRVLGEEHPATLTSLNNLAATLNAQGDLPGALALQEQALEIKRRVLGEEHPDTSISAFNLFATLLQAERAGGRATEVFRDCLAWLPPRDPAGLGADQRNIRGQLIEYFGMDGPQGGAKSG